MCAFAVALGYKDIYIAGIDLYSTNKTYAFDGMKNNLLIVRPDFKEMPDAFHTPNTDLEALAFLTSHYNVRFCCLCPNSPIAKHIPLANVLHSDFNPKLKSKDCIADILIPSHNAYRKMIGYHSPLDKQKQRLKNNLIYKIIKDLVRLPGDTIPYIKSKYIQK